MILENCCQVNSNFFYSKHFNFNIMPYKTKFSVNPKKLNQSKFNSLMEHVVFTEGYVTHMITSEGEFLFYGVTHDLETKQILNILKNQAQFAPIYFFRNVDYFSYGEFGFAEEGKVVRYLKVNSEAMGDEPVVEWVGKPHKWEYDTHTFYTKQKLEDFEMFFDSDNVCEMIYYYLPFVTKNIEIKEITIYSYSENGKKIVDGVIKGKPFIELKQITNHDKAEIYKNLIHNNLESAGTTILVFKDKIFLNNYLVNSTGFDMNIPEKSYVSFTNKSQTILNKNLNYKTFYNAIIDFIIDYKNAKKVHYTEAQNYLKKIEKNESYFQTHLVTDFFEKDQTLVVAYGVGRYFDFKRMIYSDIRNTSFLAGQSFDSKTIKKIYKSVLKVQKMLS